MSLIYDISEIKNSIAIDVSSTIENIKPDIREAEEDYIMPALGQATYDEINQIYNDNPELLTEDQSKLLDLCQTALSNLAFARYIIVNRVSFSNSGIRIIEDGNYKTAYKYMFDEIIDNFTRRGFNYIDKLLAFLESKKDVFTDWAEDESAFTINKKHFIRTADEFDAIYRINRSRRTFMALEPTIQSVEDFMIEYSLGVDQYNDLKDKIKAGGDLSEDDQALLAKVQPALAYLTIGHAIEELSFEVSEHGLLIKEQINTGETNWKKSTPSDARLEGKRKSAMDTGNRYLEKLKDFLNKNASAETYPLYFASEAYISPDTSSTRAQTTSKTFVA